MLTERPPVVAERNPRILANPFEFGLAGAFLLAGLKTITILTDYGDQPRIGILAMPPVVLWGWIISIIVGALLILAGLALPGRHAMVRAAERAGLCLSFASWASLSVVLLNLDWHDWGSWGEYACFSVSCILRLVAMHRYERGLHKAAEFRKKTER